MKKRIWVMMAVVVMVLCVVGTAYAGNTPETAAETGAGGAVETAPEETALPTGDGNEPAPTASPSPEPNDALWIDGTYIETGMNAAYMNGYTPSTEGGVAKIVLPLLAADSVKKDAIYCTLGLGGDTSPFVISNYDNIPVAPKTRGGNLFVAHFSLPLKTDRVNGGYPVTISVKYKENGVDGYAAFNVNVWITDGKAAGSDDSTDDDGTIDGGTIDNGTSDGGTSDGGASDGGVIDGGTSGGSGDTSPSQPKVIMDKYTITPNPVYAGDTFTAKVTLKNTSTVSSVNNMVISYKSEGTSMIPAGGVTTAYIAKIDPGGIQNFSFDMGLMADAESGPQKIVLSMEYEDNNKTPYSATDEMTVQVKQQIRLEYDDPKFPATAYIGDSLYNTLNLYNKGKSTLYNVTVTLNVPGITPDSSIFLGNMESGSEKSADIYATVGDMEGNTLPGPVEGEYLVTYEDDYGEELELRIPVSTELVEMNTEEMDFYPEGDMPEGEEDITSGIPWWTWIIIAGVGVVVAVVVVTRMKKKKREKELMEDIDSDELS